MASFLALPAVADYAFTSLDVPGAMSTTPTSINDRGQVAGYYTDAATHEHGFMYSGGAFNTLDVPGAVAYDTQTISTSININASGQIAGFYSDATGVFHGFVYSGGAFTTLDAPGSMDTYVAGINASGHLAGFYTDASKLNHGFVYSGGSFTILDAPGSVSTRLTSINDSGQVAGALYQAGHGEQGPWGFINYPKGFLFSGGVFTILDPISTPSYYDPLGIPTYSWASSINASGQVAGYATYGPTHSSFVYSKGTFTFLNAPGSDFTTITILSNGEAVGFYENIINERTTLAFNSVVYSNGMFITLDLQVATSIGIASINASGKLAGSYIDFNGNTHGFVAVPTPLTVSNANSAGGTIVSNVGGIDCGTTCSANFSSGTAVTLTAIPASGYEFTGWGGACSGYGNSCKVTTVNAAQTVTANFAPFKIRQPSWKRVINSLIIQGGG